MSEALKRARLLTARGRRDKAARIYESIAETEPDHFEALLNLGVFRLQQQRFQDAQLLLEAACNLNPGDLTAAASHGLTLASLGRNKQALASYERALAIDPQHHETLYNRGNALRELRRPEEALASYDRALAVKAQSAEALNNRGNALKELGRLGEALESYDKALAVKPRLLDALFNRAAVLTELRRTAEAVDAYEKALAISPGHAAVQVVCGDLLMALARPKEALRRYENAIAADPSCAMYHDRKGVALTEIGRLDEAARAHERAAALDPSNASFHYNFAQATKLSVQTPAFQAMLALSSHQGSASWREKVTLGFAMGKVYADNQDFKAAFRHYSEGAALKRRGDGYDERAALADMRNIGAIFPTAALRANAGLGAASIRPVFIVGMPRSGTTLAEQILASHPKAFGAGEIFDFAEAAKTYAGPSLQKLNLSDRVSDELTTRLRNIGDDYSRRIEPKAPTAERIINKMPDNFRLVGLIHLALPNARIIHMRRDPLDTCVSCFTKLFTEGNGFSYDLGDLGRYYKAYERLMEHWRDALPDGTMLEVQYEDLVEDLEGQSRRMVAFCGLEWDARCLDFPSNARPVRTASAAQVRQPLFRSSIGRWRDYEPYLGPLMTALGSERTGAKPNPKQGPRGVAAAFKGLWGRLTR